MSTVNALIDRLYREWLTPATQQDVYALLNGSLTNSTSTVVVSLGMLAVDEQGLISPGTVIEVEQEQMLVTAISSDLLTLTVRRGYAGTTAASHADSLLVTIQPQFTRQSAFDAVADEIVSLHPALWGLETGTLVSASTPVEVPADVVGLAGVSWVDTNTVVRSGRASLLRNYPPSATGRAVQFLDVTVGKTAYVTYKTKFARPTSGSDTLASLNVDTSWGQIVVLGAAGRLSGYIDPSRLNVNWAGEAEQNQTSPPGTATGLHARLMSMRNSLLEEAAQRLRQEYPGTVTWNDPFRPASVV
jgi:hypothetical protein